MNAGRTIVATLAALHLGCAAEVAAPSPESTQPAVVGSTWVCAPAFACVRDLGAAGLDCISMTVDYVRRRTDSAWTLSRYCADVVGGDLHVGIGCNDVGARVFDSCLDASHPDVCLCGMGRFVR